MPDASRLLVVSSTSIDDALRDAIVAWFGRCGEIAAMVPPYRLGGGSDAKLRGSMHGMVLQFADTSCVSKALVMRSRPGGTGVPAWVEAYRDERPDPRALQREVDHFMAEFEAKEAAERERVKAAANTVDDDGFVLVTKKSKDKPFESEHQKKKKRKLEQGGAGMQLAPLYRFQMRESKRNSTCRAVC